MLFLLVLGIVYAAFDPASSTFFPACPFHSFTGLMCPGCGSQRALHHLLNLQVQTAYSYNPLLVISLPYIMAGTVIDHYPNPPQKLLKWRQFFFGRTAILLILFVIIAFWILRNL
ncbi:DUF2752 domain-containing protein [Salinimicrobium sp. TH3]|uniref:DUF2752 domain-containing protein n=1 Tax=Salinimicrobium sp. TH3 TaxID=2997342 RepID=UPI002273BC87|nr:DUF2752 domain-containing protein [Salinimicrobium sp. TH3]MCY2687185.1 DUF2752 domain-containing protein [Salinimicrobium sp. TH3]